MPTVDQTVPTLASHTSGTIAASGDIVLTFSEAMVAGSGNIVITDGATQTYMSSSGALRTRVVGATDTRTISITGPEVSISGNVVTINLGSDLKAGLKYSVHMAGGVLEDAAGTDYKGLADSTRLNFTTSAAAAPSALVGSAISMTDSGVLATDYITNATSQVFAGSYSGTLAEGDIVQVSLDGGASWQPAVVSGNSWSYASTISDDGLVMARVTNTAGVSSTQQSQAFVLDVAAPAAPTIALGDASLAAGETTTVTVTFGEKVTGLTAADFTVSGGTLGAFASTDAGLTWTATLTPTANANGSGGIALAAGSVTDIAGNAGPAAASGATSFSYSTTTTPVAQVASFSMTDTGDSATDFITNATAQTITGTLSATLGSGESVQVSLNDGGTWQDASTSGTSWSYSGTISASNTLQARVSNGVQHSEALSHAYTLDQAAPTTSSIVLSDYEMTAGETAVVTVTFAEAVSGLTSSDFSVSGGTLGEFDTTDEGITWTATLTPTSASSGSGSVQLLTSSVTDAAGNTGPATSSVATYTYNTVVAPSTPTATVDSTIHFIDSGSSATDYLTKTAAQTVTGTYTGTLAGGESVEVSLNGGASWGTASATAGGWSFSGTISASDTIVARVTNGSNSSASAAQAYTYDAAAPTFTAELSNSSFKAGETGTLTIVFSENVEGLTAEDFTVIGCTISNVGSNDGITWTATVTPASGSSGSGSITLAGAVAATDIAGNEATGSQQCQFDYNTIAPALGSGFTLSDDTGSSETDFITHTAAQTISGTFTGYVNTTAGAAIEVSPDNGVSWQAATVDNILGTWSHGTTLTASGMLKVRLTDTENAVSTLSQAYELDTTAPSSPTLALSDSSLLTGQTATLTVTFTEKIAALSASDFALSGGTLGSFSTSDSGLTWSATLTPAVGSADSGSLTLLSSAVDDLAGNSGPASATSIAFNYDTQTPSLTASTLEISDDSGTLDNDFITKTASQTVTGGFSGTVFAATGARIDVSADGSTWTQATVDNTAHTFSASITLSSGAGTLYAKLTDSSGAVTSQTHSYTLDTTAPAALTNYPIALYGESDTGQSDSDGITHDSAPTLSVNVAGSGLVEGDVLQVYDVTGSTVVGSHTLSAYEATEGGFTMQISALEEGSHELALRVEDLAGNISQSPSLTITEDYTAPALSSSSITNGGTIGIDDAQTITLTFSEALDLSSANGISVSNGSDTRGIVFEASGSSYVEYNDSTYTITVHLAASLEYGSDYIVTVYSAPLPDVAGNMLAAESENESGSELLHFSTEPQSEAPSAPTLSLLSDSDNATDNGSGSDFITNSGTIAVSGLTAAHAEYTTSAGDLWTPLVIVDGAATFTLDDGSYSTAYLKVRQYDSEDYPSDSAYLDQTLTVDTTAPTVHVSGYPSFFGLGLSNIISTLTGSISGSANIDEFIEYTTDSGANWTLAGSLDGTAWSLSGLQLAEGGAVGLRVSDVAGNIGGNADLDIISGYTVYVGDGYGGTFDAAITPYLHAGDGDDTINLSSVPTGEINGGEGTDQLYLNSSNMDVASALSHLSSFEYIDLGSSNSMTLTASDVITLSETGTLKVYGDSTDHLYLDSSVWSESEPIGLDGWESFETASGVFLHIYTNSVSGVQLHWDA